MEKQKVCIVFYSYHSDPPQINKVLQSKDEAYAFIDKSENKDDHHEVWGLKEYEVEPSVLKIPTVHINGTDKGTLEHYLRLQLDALRSAAKNMRIYGPHERDYYMQEKGAYQKAQDQQDLRIEAVDRVIVELEHILEKVNEQ